MCYRWGGLGSPEKNPGALAFVNPYAKGRTPRATRAHGPHQRSRSNITVWRTGLQLRSHLRNCDTAFKICSHPRSCRPVNPPRGTPWGTGHPARPASSATAAAAQTAAEQARRLKEKSYAPVLFGKGGVHTSFIVQNCCDCLGSQYVSPRWRFGLAWEPLFIQARSASRRIRAARAFRTEQNWLHRFFKR